jgi:hypothetical protein
MNKINQILRVSWATDYVLSPAAPPVHLIMSSWVYKMFIITMLKSAKNSEWELWQWLIQYTLLYYLSTVHCLRYVSLIRDISWVQHLLVFSLANIIYWHSYHFFLNPVSFDIMADWSHTDRYFVDCSYNVCDCSQSRISRCNYNKQNIYRCNYNKQNIYRCNYNESPKFSSLSNT